jgi:hypothetical protein
MSDTRADLPKSWDALGPPRGECAFCGHPDARHRVADTIAEHVTAHGCESSA